MLAARYGSGQNGRPAAESGGAGEREIPLKRSLIMLAVVAAFASMGVGHADTAGTGSCIAVQGSPCEFQAGSESGATDLGDGALVLNGRGSWIAAGDWTITVFEGSCANKGGVLKTYSSASDNNVAPVLGANNGGVYFGLCAAVSADSPGSIIGAGMTYSNQLP
jgi:hypothetical protein